MGMRNRERRRAKQKARDQQQQRRRQERTGGDFVFGSPTPPLPPPQIAELMVGSAVAAKHHEDAVELQRCLQVLRDWPASQGGHLVADRAVLRILRQAVEHCWRHGWQPADVVRVVGRSLGRSPHTRLTVDAIAAQMRSYPAATVDERWEAQLKELDATVWWGDDDQYIASLGERLGLDRAAVFSGAVDILVVLNSLPELPQLCPPPGTARRVARAATGPAVDPRMLDRVRALLAKAESTTFPEEAEAYTAKAQELMARHSIDHALLAAGSAAGNARDEPGGRRVGIDNPYEAPKVLLLDAVARANRCRTVWSKELGFTTVIGYPGDLDAVELLFTSLLVQATAAMVHAGSRRDFAGRSRTRSFRQSFLTAYAGRIGERLRAATDQVSRQAAGEPGHERLLPVLAARDHTVQSATDKMFPGLTVHQVAARDREGWASGTAAADLASLGIRGELRDNG